MSDMWIGLLSGGAGGIAFALCWLAVETLVKRRQARAQAAWDAEVEQAIRLSETPLYDLIRAERGNAAAAGGVVVLVLVLLLGGAFVAARLSSEKTITCTVTDKDRATKVTSDGNGGTTSRSDARIYTEDCGTLQVADEFFKGEFTSADTYASIEPGRRYEFRVIGWRIGFFSEFPNVLEATEVDQ